MKIDPIIGLIAQLPEIAYPTGWRFHHKNRILNNESSIVPKKPKTAKPTAGISVSGILVNHPSNRWKASVPNQDKEPF